MPMPSVNSQAYEDNEVSEEVMTQYYQRLLPFRLLFQWLNHSPTPSKDFIHREIAFSLANDVYVRYLSFSNHEEFKREVLRLHPTRFEIGPVYSANPQDRKVIRKAEFKPLYKELVFDIDMTDYDDVRTCCEGANICNKCWKFITVAIKIIDAALRNDFGFSHVLWVYSGRRGVHAWISDKRARELSDKQRSAVASYLHVLGKIERGKRANIRRPFHPHVQNSLDILKTEFAQIILNEQDPWRTQEGEEGLLKLLPDGKFSQDLQREWHESGNSSSLATWDSVGKLASSGKYQNATASQIRNCKQDIIFEYLYPRLDINVSKKQIHLLKSPYCVHPKTGRICVPIPQTELETFDPLSVPTVGQLLNEINNFSEGEEGQQTGKIHDYEKTSLKKYINYFQEYVNEVCKDEIRSKRKLEEEKLSF